MKINFHAKASLLKILGARNKFTLLRYYSRTPLRFLAILGGGEFRGFYFSKTLEKISESSLDLCLRDFLPEQFLTHLKEKEFFNKVDGRLLIYYLMVRKFKPEIVVETGVAEGASSAFILAGMEENRRGRLYSIDLPPADARISKKEFDGITLVDGQKHSTAEQTGHLVPEYLKERWTLILGDSKRELPILLSEIGTISMFLHDSLHTYEHMLFEYETAWPHIEKGGFLLSHDVTDNDAFMDFSKRLTGSYAKPILYYSLGIIKK